MKISCPMCSTSVAYSTSVWEYEFSELVQCNNCGLIHHLRNDMLHAEQAFTTYHNNSWGHGFEDVSEFNINSSEIMQHAARIEFNLQYFSKFLNITEDDCVLDIGAGVGLLEFVAQETNSPIHNTNLVMIEPVVENYRLLRKRYPNHTAVNCHINQIRNVTPTYDAIFCQGVDYLFGDINESFKILHGLLKPDGLMLISRNLFIDMPCYFGGKPIGNKADIFSPNALINAYFLETHYKEFLEKNFDIVDEMNYEEKYGESSDLVVGQIYNYVLKKKDSSYDETPLDETKYLTQYNETLKRLSKK
ncbi:class I SAM-dependent methyltransferase [Sulfurimonas sp.]|uniref:class I SAM-dependent methyltransferase n=1 Tax=Sulfurimonas sp. TaxID=2022749 RepID=UPI003565319B